MRELNTQLLRLSEEMVACADAACAVRVARRMEARAREGQALVDELRTDLGEDAPECLRDVLGVYARSLSALEKAAIAVQEGKADVAERQGTRAGELGVQVERDLASCLESVGA